MTTSSALLLLAGYVLFGLLLYVVLCSVISGLMLYASLRATNLAALSPNELELYELVAGYAWTANAEGVEAVRRHKRMRRYLTSSRFPSGAAEEYLKRLKRDGLVIDSCSLTPRGEAFVRERSIDVRVALITQRDDEDTVLVSRESRQL